MKEEGRWEWKYKGKGGEGSIREDERGEQDILLDARDCRESVRDTRSRIPSHTDPPIKVGLT